MVRTSRTVTIPGWLEPAVSSQRRINGVLLHHVEAGPAEAPLVILLHGFPDFWWGWRRQMGHLATSGLRVIALDQRGYNLSGKPLDYRSYDLETLAMDVIGLADAYGASKVRLVGHDFGGLVAWWAAIRHPERVERLAVINAPHPQVFEPYLRSHPTQMMRSLYAAFFQLPWVPEVTLSTGHYAALRQALLGSSREGVFSREDLDRYEQAWSEPGALKAMLDWYRALRLRPHLESPRVAVPTLIVWGLQDRFLEKGLAEESLALCDDGQLSSFENASHWVHLEEADAVNGALAGFLKSSARRP